MATKVEMLIQVCINGRAIWRKAKTMKAELSKRLTDREYDKVLDAGIVALGYQVDAAIAKEKATAKEKVNA